MPLQPAYSWSETDKCIKITVENVPVKDQGQLFCSDRVVKLNVPPYLLLLDLKHAVDDDRSTATIVKGRKVVINLAKAEPGPWCRLTADGDAAAIKKKRQESVQRAHQKLLAAQQQRQARKQQEERAAVDLQLQQQAAQRNQLEALKQQELHQERQELQEWQQQLDQGDESEYEDDTTDADAQVNSSSSSSNSSSSTTHSKPESSHTSEDAYHGKGWWPSKATPASEQLAVAPNSSEGSGRSSSSSRGDGEAPEQPLQPAAINSRPEGCAGVLSRLGPEEVGTQAAAAAALQGQLQSEETDAEPLMTATSSRRLAASTSSSGGSSSSQGRACAPGSKRPVAPVRSRAAAVQVTFTQLETPHLPAREQRELDIKQIKRVGGSKDDSMGVSDRQPAFLKDKGDAFAAQGNYRGAINAYSKALELDPSQAGLWANRAAAHMALGQAAECVQDCTQAITLVEQAVAALQAASGAATEREIQASMLGAAATPGSAAATVVAVASGAQVCGTAAAPQARAPGCECCGCEAPTRAGTDVTGVTAATTDTISSSSSTASGGEEVLGTDSSSSSSNSRPQLDSTGSSSSSTAGGEAAGVAEPCGLKPSQQQQQQQEGVTQRLKQLLVKLLARRAAAHVELQQLQEAADDLQRALRLDPGSLQLQADALEVSLALSPDSSSSSEPAGIKQLATARFKAGDMQAAAEAFTALLDVLQQRQQQQQSLPHQSSDTQQQQQQVAGAFSNRAACWLGINRYEECVADCWAALEAMWPGSGSSAATPGEDGSEAAAQASGDSNCGSSDDAGGVARRLSHIPARQLKSCAQSAARVVARLAAAYACLKAVPQADAAFEWAAACWLLLGEHSRVASIRADQARLHELHGRLVV